jgi:hypothetical protein
VAAEAIKDLLNAIFGSSPFSPKYSMNGKLIMDQIIMVDLRMFHRMDKFSLFTFNFLHAPFMCLVTLFSE